MKFGVLQFFSWPGRRVPLATIYDRAFQRTRIMDETGYDAVWLAEHHFSTYSVCPSVHVMGTHIAAHTKRLRIGTAVSLAGFYHPLRLAEEVALLDHLSGGRVNWGAGRGFDASEHKVFGVDPKDSYPKFRENVEIVLKAWGSDKFTHHGEFWDFEDIEVLPKPLQDPMPVWLAAASNEAIEWAAEKGFSIMMSPHAGYSDIADKKVFYRQTLESAGHEYGRRDIPVARTIALAETQEEAEAIGRRGAEFMFGAYLRNNHHIRGKPGDATGKTQSNEALLAAEAANMDPVERYIQQVAICGTPERAIDIIQELQETVPLDYLMIAPLSHSSFTLFTEKVLPKFL
jgi:alkanesulfonate monooxygenase SsuD/methylene tetrahydromethanopterin reductase-like flavin-dependent oxidoreductase (luciferase family)